MKNVNVWITIALGVLAVGMWAFAVSRAVAVWTVPPTFLAAAISLSVMTCFGWLLTSITAARDHETRCRRCKYILRGLSEPRCPECGERI